jgi:quercetin dioxygenase-like cupin family protein
MIAVDDPALLEFLQRRPGCGKHVLEERAAFQLSVYRLEPGARVLSHSHTRSHDIFVGVEGRLRIELDADGRRVPFVLRPGGVCSVPPGIVHEVASLEATANALFVLVHAPYDRFDHVPRGGARHGGGEGVP